MPAAIALSPRDLIRVAVFNEPDMTVDRRIDANGSVSLPLIGNIDLNRLTVSEAQEKNPPHLHRHGDFRPAAGIGYRHGIFAQGGFCHRPGQEPRQKSCWPIEVNALEIVDVISKAGGVTRLGRSDSGAASTAQGGGRRRANVSPWTWNACSTGAVARKAVHGCARGCGFSFRKRVL